MWPRQRSAAILAERIVREALGFPAGGRALYADPTFRGALWALCDRVANMELRYLEVADRTDAHDLEIFVDVVLQPRYSRFEWFRWTGDGE